MVPHFHTQFDTKSGDTWIVDGQCRIARLRPPRLYDVVLTANRPSLIRWLTLFWWQYTNNELPGRSAWLVDELRLDDQVPTAFRLYLRTHNSDKSVESHCHLQITRDQTNNSYIYDVTLALQVQPGKTWVVEPQGGVEFLNIWCRDAAGPAVPSANMPPQRWQWVLYRNQDREVAKVALNHLGGPHMWQIFFAEHDGWLAYADHADGNPLIELPADTARNTRAEVCAWGYDLHFILRTHSDAPWQPEPTQLQMPESTHVLTAGQSVQARYRLRTLPAPVGERLMGEAVPVVLDPSVERQLVRPVYVDGVNTFVDEIRPQTPHTGWYWEPSPGQGPIWDRTQGRTDSASLHVHNREAAQAYWEVALGADFWGADLSGTVKRLGGWIRTENCVGHGAYLSFQYSSYERRTGQLPALSTHQTIPLTGTQPWTYVEVPIPAPADDHVGRGYVQLVLEGAGKAWFDDIILLNL